MTIKLLPIFLILTFFINHSMADNEVKKVDIKSVSVDLDAPIEDLESDDLKKLMRDILEDIEDSIEGSSNSKYKAVRIVEATVNNFNIKKSGINLSRAFNYYSHEYRNLFLDLMTSKLITHGIETTAAAAATIIQFTHPELTGWQRTGLGFIQSLAIPGAVDFLCWAGDACFISFYSYRKAMRKIRLNLVKVPKKMGVQKLWNMLFVKIDGRMLIDDIISSNKRINNFVVRDYSNDLNTYKLVDKKTNKVYCELTFDRRKDKLSLSTIRFFEDTIKEIPKKPLEDFLSLFNSNINEAVLSSKEKITNNKIDQLNKLFHIEEVVTKDIQAGTETKKVHDISLRNNTVLLKSKRMLKSKARNFCTVPFKYLK